MANDVIGRALIEILPDFSAFGPQSQKEGERLGRQAGEAFASAFNKALANLNFDPKAAERAAKGLANGVGKGLDQVAKDAEATGGKVEASLTKSAKAAADNMAKAAKSGAPFKPIADDASATGGKVEETFRNTAARVDSALRQRGADGRFKAVEADAATTGTKVSETFRETAAKVDANLRGRTSTGQFKSVESDAEVTSKGIQGWFDKARAGVSGQLDRLRGDAKGSFDKIEASAKNSGVNIGKLLFSGAALYAGIRGIQALAGQVKESIDAYEESAKIGRITEAVVKSTGGAANVSADQVGKLSAALSMQTGIDDEVIQASSNVLLTFKGVADQAGKNNDIFTRTQKAALDMSTVLGGDASGAAMMLGKALNDPEKGMSKLARSGVTFTDQQKEQVKAMVAVGDTLGAQKIILQEVNSEFGGAAAAAANPMERLAVITGNLKENLGAGLVSAINPLADSLMALAPAIEPVATALGEGLGGVISALAPAIAAIAPILGAVMEPLGRVLGVVGDHLARLFEEIAPVIGPLFGALANALAPILGTIGRLAATLLPPLIAAFTTLVTAADPLISFIAILANLFGQILAPILEQMAPILALMANAFVEMFAPIINEGGVIDGIFESLVTTFTTLAPILGEIALTIGGALGEALKVLAPILGDIMVMFADLVGQLLPPLAEMFSGLITAIAPIIPILAEGLGKALEAIMPILPVIADAFLRIFDALSDPSLMAALVELVGALVDVVVELLPVLLPLIPAFVQLVPPLVELAVPLAKVVAGLLSFKPLLIGLVAPIVALQVATRVWAAVQGALNLAMSANPVVLVAIAIAALGAAFYLAYTKVEPFRNVIDGIGRFFRDTLWPILQDVGGFLGEVLAKGFEMVKDQAMLFVQPIMDIVGAFQALISGDFGGFLSGMGDAFGSWLTFVTDIPMKIMGLLGDLAPMVWEWFKGAFMWVVTNAGALLAEFGAWAMTLPGTIIGLLGDLGSKIAEWFVAGFMWVATNSAEMLADFFLWLVWLPFEIIGLLGNIGWKIGEWLVAGFSWVVENGPGILLGIGNWFLALPGKVIGWLAGFGTKLFNWAKEGFGVIVSRGGEIVSGVITFAASVPGRIIRGFGAIGSQLVSWLRTGFDYVVTEGPGLIKGVVDFFAELPGKILSSIGSGLSKAGSAVGDIAGKLWKALKGFINEKLIDPLREKEISIGPVSAKPFSALPRLAEGGMFDKATQVIVGEAGPEVIIPLTKPDRARKLLEESGLAATLAASGPAAVAALSAPAAVPSVPMGVGVAPGATEGTDAWFTSFAPQATEALSTFGEEVWAGSMASFMFLQTQILAVFNLITTFLTTWPLVVWTAMLPALGILSTNLRTSVDAMGNNVTSRFGSMATGVGGVLSALSVSATGQFRSMLSTLESHASTGGASVVSALRSALQVGTTEVGAIVSGYARKLAESLNPLLKAMGKPEINVAAFRSGGINDPRIVGDGSNNVHVFGEKGTHGEAYIPFNPALRQRSRGIAAETVQRLGGQATFFAEGGITGGKVTGDLQGLNPEFLRRLHLWSASVGQTYNVGSGYRSMQEQARLYADWLAGVPGQAQAAAPGSSNHNFGLASDGNHWRNLNPQAFGLRFPMSFEPWHVEPIEAKAWRGLMPDSGWIGGPTMTPLAKAPDAGKRGVLSRVAKDAMAYGYDTALDWATKAMPTSSVGGTLDPSFTAGGPAGSPAIRDLGKRMNAAKGWDAYWPALEALWTRESGWNPLADNPTSTAYGIAQFLDSTWASTGIAKTSDPALQIEAGLRYIGSRYGNPQGAASFWQKHHWYGDGALFNGPTIAGVGEDGAEVLLPMTKPQRALQLAVDSGLMNVLDEERGQVTGTGASTATTTAYDGGVLGGRTGNVYHIYGLTIEQVMAEVEARDAAAERIRT